MSAAAANAPCVVVQIASTTTRIDFGRQGFIVEEDFAAGYFGIPYAAVWRERTKFTDTRFNVVVQSTFGIQFIHRHIMIAVELTGFQIDIRLDLRNQFPVFVQFRAQPKLCIEVGIGIFRRRIDAAVVSIDVFGIRTYAQATIHSQQIIENTDFIVIFANDTAGIDVIVGRGQSRRITSAISILCQRIRRWSQ